MLSLVDDGQTGKMQLDPGAGAGAGGDLWPQPVRWDPVQVSDAQCTLSSLIWLKLVCDTQA